MRTNYTSGKFLKTNNWIVCKFARSTLVVLWKLQLLKVSRVQTFLCVPLKLQSPVYSEPQRIQANISLSVCLSSIALNLYTCWRFQTVGGSFHLCVFFLFGLLTNMSQLALQQTYGFCHCHHMSFREWSEVADRQLELNHSLHTTKGTSGKTSYMVDPTSSYFPCLLMVVIVVSL